MTLPKRRLPGTAYFLTGVCERHEFRLKPMPETNAAFAFTLMESAMRHGVDVVAVCQMSSHYHAVVFDRLGTLSEFLRDFHGVMGKYGSARDEVEKTKFWCAEGGREIELGDMDTVIEKVAYSLANPTKDFVVSEPREWIGAMTPVKTLGMGVGKVYQRPKRFFDTDGGTSESVMLWSDYPCEFSELMGVDEFRARVEQRVGEYVAAAQAEVAAGRAEWFGVERAKKVSVWHSVERERAAAGKKAKATKKVAAATMGRLQAMLEALLAFRKAHRRAWEAFRAGAEAMFPAGTWKAWRFYGASREEGVAEAMKAPG